MLRRACFVMPLLAASLGCSMDNPAYEGSGGTDATSVASDSEDGEATAEVGESSDDGSTTSEPGTSDTNDTNDTNDTSDTGPIDTCEQGFRPPLRLTVRPPEGACTEAVSGMILRVDLNTLNQEQGIAMGSKCVDTSCVECNIEDYFVGAPGFAGLAQVWSKLSDLTEGNGLEALCIKVEATQLIEEFDNNCIYGSMAIHDYAIEHAPVFVGNVNQAPLTAIATGLLANTLPSVAAEPSSTCSCEVVFANSDTAASCCAEAGLEPRFYDLSFAGTTPTTGTSEPVSIGQVPWQFHALQAQVAPSCKTGSDQLAVSWALTRVE